MLITDSDQLHLIHHQSTARDALRQLDQLPSLNDRTLFVINDQHRVLGTITDGDIRRGLLRDSEISEGCIQFMNTAFKFLKEGDADLEQVRTFRALEITLIPVLNENGALVRLVNLKKQRSFIPASALIMAGGRGERLKPLTDLVPKPMLKLGNRPIIEYNVERLAAFGIREQFISINYLGEQIEAHFKEGEAFGAQIKYVQEDKPLGTLGALGKIDRMEHEHLLVMNSDILSNIDYEDFFRYYIESGADFCVASVPYKVTVPYAVLETGGRDILSLEEKPTYTYYSSAGIYFMKTELKSRVPLNEVFDATDLMNDLIATGMRVTHYPLLNYWLDIGRQADFLKAQEDIKQIRW